MLHYAWKRVSNSVARSSYTDRIDAILASYPKSGRTWFRFILSSYLNKAYGLKAAPDLHSMFTVVPNFDMDATRGLPAFGFGNAKPKPPLIAVSHRSYSARVFRKCPTIFMLRNPKDVIVSSYFHATGQKHRFSGSLDEFLTDRGQGVAALTEYLNGWARGLQQRRHVTLSYERLTADPMTETARVLNFLGLDVEQHHLAAAVEAASFQNMRKLELRKGLPGHDYDRTNEENLRMRRGKVGGFADYLTDAQIALIDRMCERDLTDAAKALLKQVTI
ncbi:sulfotransferase domain-containing protein [Paracoccus xiamenensis]|uniref:sulfotransferase domain-containing protein n=1 Tax=Paracoccus xiamenensis TaxID=2714901 RepID=UPI001F3FF152|nr:sulfotransferase domain-containing protein [Paracoccus xiamenensis]